VSQFDPQGNPIEQPQADPALVRRRPASVQLRQSDATSSPTDSANQALGDALRVVYRFLQFGMVALVIFFLFSGLQRVQEGERGLRISLGKVVRDDLTPGLQLSLPRPFGEIMKIPTGNQTLDVRDDFWPGSIPQADRFKEDAVIARTGGSKLDPIQDGFVLTGDLSMGHVLAKIEYVREPDQIAKLARKIHPESEQRIIKAAVMQGIVRAAAGSTIDQFRKDLSMQAIAREQAQLALDQLDAGISLRSLILERRMVPPGLINVFNEVESSLAQTNKAVSEAQQIRAATLSNAAGDAAEDLLALISKYEQLWGAGTDNSASRAEAEKVLKQIDAILDGQPVGADGIRPGAIARGRAGNLLQEAQADRSRAVSQAQSDAAIFLAKLEAYKANPGVVLLGEWRSSYRRFIDRDTVQIFLHPEGSDQLHLLINRDQDLQKEQESKRAEEENKRILEENARKLREQAFTSPTAITTP
jgi:hypothetical protein